MKKLFVGFVVFVLQAPLCAMRRPSEIITPGSESSVSLGSPVSPADQVNSIVGRLFKPVGAPSPIGRSTVQDVSFTTDLDALTDQMYRASLDEKAATERSAIEERQRASRQRIYEKAQLRKISRLTVSALGSAECAADRLPMSDGQLYSPVSGKRDRQELPALSAESIGQEAADEIGKKRSKVGPASPVSPQ